jgi:putative FmdB family regulatory protein
VQHLLRIGEIAMPLYEYQCAKCGGRIEIIQRVSDPPLPICPKCGGDMKKLISSPAIQFKGSGFYKTDYGTKDSGGSSSKSSESGSDSKSDTKSDSKSDSKSESKSDAGGGSSSSSGGSGSKPAD